MARQMLNDGFICVTVFNSENDSMQATFQVYAPGKAGDCYEYQVVEANMIQLIEKNLKVECGT